MIRLDGIRSEKIWGYEDWIASTHPNGLQKEFAEFVGGDYPLLVKIIQANETLSVQVHPDNEKAELYEHCRGKTECWYVLDAKESAEIVYGLNGAYSDSELRKAIEANTLHDCLRYVPVKKGDFIYIPSGTVHAICGGLRLLEVQQSSDITYRLYDWGRGRECHVERGISCIKSTGVRDVKPFASTFSCPYFQLEEISVEDNYMEEIDDSNVVLIYVLEGKGTVNGMDASEENIFAFKPGEKIEASGSLKLMKIAAA